MSIKGHEYEAYEGGGRLFSTTDALRRQRLHDEGVALMANQIAAALDIALNDMKTAFSIHTLHQMKRGKKEYCKYVNSVV